MRRTNVWVLAIGLALLAGCAEKPVMELQQVREAVAAARDFEADIYAPDEYDLAVMNLESGEFAMAEQDAAPLWSRNYTLALDLLALAMDQAEQAQAIAEANKEDVFLEAQTALPEAERMFQLAFEAVEEARTGPITRQDLQAFEDELAGAFATLTQARGIFESGDYPSARILLLEVQERSTALDLRARRVPELANTPF